MTEIKSEEISLLDLLASFVRTLKQNLALSIFLPAAGAFVTVLIGMTGKSHFESGLMIETSLLSVQEATFLLKEVAEHRRLPGVERSRLRPLRDFEFVVIAEPGQQTGTPVEASTHIEVTVRANDSIFFQFLERELLNYLNRSGAAAKNRKAKELFYRRMIAKIDAEIAGLDVIKREVSAKGQATFLNPSDLYAHTVDLFKDKTFYEIELEQASDIQVSKGFDMVVEKQAKPAVGALAGFIGGFVVLSIVLFIKFFIRYLHANEVAR